MVWHGEDPPPPLHVIFMFEGVLMVIVALGEGVNVCAPCPRPPRQIAHRLPKYAPTVLAGDPGHAPSPAVCAGQDLPPEESILLVHICGLFIPRIY
jgi:hypothetical protein